MRLRGFGLIGMAAAWIVLNGCDATQTVQPLSAEYDLSDYLFPEGNATTTVMRLFAAQRPKENSAYSEETYLGDATVRFVRAGNRIEEIFRLPEGGEHRLSVTITSDTMTVEDSDLNATYRMKRRVMDTGNFIMDTPIKETREDAGTSTVTYECNVTGTRRSLVVEPNPKVFDSIVETVCLQRTVIHAQVGGKTVKSIEEMRQENAYAEGVGPVRIIETTCAYTQVDEGERIQEGCVRHTMGISASISAESSSR
jgi:hypothetical protein